MSRGTVIAPPEALLYVVLGNIISGIVPTVCYFSVFHFIIKTRIAFVKYTVQSRRDVLKILT